MVFSLLEVLIFLEDIFDGSAIHVTLLNLPLTAVSGAYRRVGPVCQMLFCFQWIRFLLDTLPRPKKGLLGRLFKGALLGVLLVEYYGWKWLAQVLPKTSYSQLDLGLPLLAMGVFGLLAMLLHPQIVYSEEKGRRIARRVESYKQHLHLNVRFCAECERYQYFRSVHSPFDGHCIAKFEHHSFVLNTAVGARNLLAMWLFNLAATLYHFRFLAAILDLSDNTGLTQELEPAQVVGIWLIGVYGILFSFKEFFSLTVSLVTGTTAAERFEGLKDLYFKSHAGKKTNPFHKGVLVHFLEALYAAVGHDPAKDFDSADVLALVDDEEKSKPNDAENLIRGLLNPFAYRLPANWQHLDILLMLEFDFDLRDMILKEFRKKLAGKDADEEEE